MKNGAIILLILVLFFLLGIFLLPWRSMFTTDSTVMSHLYNLTPFLVMYTTLDCLQVFLSAISRALGKHH
jgi:Na+-driven multidrug efflux pump